MFHNQSAIDYLPGSDEPSPDAKFREEDYRCDSSGCIHGPYVPEEDVELIRARHIAMAGSYIRLI